MPIPNTGDAAPDFQLKDQNGNEVKLSQYRGKHVVLYFYPKDDTSGCTREACDFRDEHSALESAGAVVLGVSPDDTKSHLKFATKYSLPFPLLADTEREVCDAYGVWGEKSLYGRKFLGVTRATFVIDTQGKVARVWPKVKVDGHVQEILAALKGDAPEKKTVAKKAAPAKKAAVKKTVTRAR
jgi:peroxiredoxin Q/BCP